MNYLFLISQCLLVSAGMFWNILWALILGFALSAMVMVFISKNKMVKALGQPGFREISLAAFFGSVSSSCSYAAVAMGKSLFEKGAHIIPALAFMMASTNLVIELSAVLWILMGWQFVVAEFIGGIILIFIMSLLMYFFAPLKEFQRKDHPSEEHDEHGTTEEGDIKTLSGWISVGQSFISEWKMLWKDIILGVVISGFLMVLVPDSFWQSLFLQNGNARNFNFPQLIENALIGPLVSVISFVCSVGNIPMANALYRAGITFGGALSFIYADLIIIPLIVIYKKYFGFKAAAWITGIFYVSMVLTGILVDVLFYFLHWIPEPLEYGAQSMAKTMSAHPTMHVMILFTWNYTTWLNILFLTGAGFLYYLSKKQAEAAPCCHT